MDTQATTSDVSASLVVRQLPPTASDDVNLNCKLMGRCPNLVVKLRKLLFQGNSHGSDSADDRVTRRKASGVTLVSRQIKLIGSEVRRQVRNM